MIFWLNERESYDELRFAGTGIHIDGSVMAIHDNPVDDLKTEARALTGRFRREKMLEKISANVGRNAGAIVLDDHHGLVAVPASRNRKDARILHGVEGV